MLKAKEPKKPLFDCLLYKWFGFETSKYQKYWKEYCNYMNNLIFLDKIIIKV